MFSPSLGSQPYWENKVINCVTGKRESVKRKRHSFTNSFFFFFNLFIYLWLCWVFVSVRGLSLVVASGGPLFIAVRGPLTIAASPVAEHRLQTRRLSNCGSRAQPLRGMWDPPRPGLEPTSPALAGRLSTTAPPGKPLFYQFFSTFCEILSQHHVDFMCK